MNSSIKITFFTFLSLFSFYLNAQQIEEIKLNPEKVKKFQPFIEWKRGGKEVFEKWKSVNKLQYAKEMWYYSESFYVRRDVNPSGQVLDESFIDVSRFENQRQKTTETVVQLSGFKDAIVLLPENSLLYKPAN